MKNEDKARKKSTIGYYSVVAFSLAVIGSVSWFAATKTDNGSAKKGEREYSGINSSYNIKEDTAKTDENTESAAKQVQDEPYYKPAETVSEEKGFVMPVEGTILKPYSSVDLQYSSTYADMRLHEGVDIKCEEGSIVKSAYKGVVVDILEDTLYGNVVVIDHGKGITVRYCGLKNVAVNKGQEVATGEQIGFSATVPCECADEPHIHIDAVIDDKSVSVFDILSEQ